MNKFFLQEKFNAPVICIYLCTSFELGLFKDIHFERLCALSLSVYKIRLRNNKNWRLKACKRQKWTRPTILRESPRSRPGIRDWSLFLSHIYISHVPQDCAQGTGVQINCAGILICARSGHLSHRGSAARFWLHHSPWLLNDARNCCPLARARDFCTQLSRARLHSRD